MYCEIWYARKIKKKLTKKRITTMNEDLKPCPFCGGKAKFGYFNSKWYVKCEKCDMELPHLYYEKEEATSKWNRRNYPEKQDSSKLSYADVERSGE
jgi:Lar family restriction alleviation protein